MTSSSSSKPLKAQAVAIASSTGGPQALAELFKSLHGQIKTVPVFITQHMPASFTTILAENIARASGMDCHEAKDGELAKPGVIYIAPGNFHMVAEFSGKGTIIKLNQNPPVNFCRPAADPMFESLSTIYRERLLAVVLTGMGADGLNGAKRVVADGGQVIAQDEATSVVWGMPKAIAEAKIAKAILPLSEIGQYITRSII